jgi:hypothetical protein
MMGVSLRIFVASGADCLGRLPTAYARGVVTSRAKLVRTT